MGGSLLHCLPHNACNADLAYCIKSIDFAISALARKSNDAPKTVSGSLAMKEN